MTQFSVLQDSVRNVLRDSEAAFISDAQIKEWLNEAQLDLCARLSLLQTNVGGTTSVTGTITLPADVLRIVSLNIDALEETGQGFITPVYVSNQVFQSYTASNAVPGEYIYRVYEDVIDIWPLLAERDYTLEYTQQPTTLSTDSDEPEIPLELQSKMVHYARAEAKLMEGEIEEYEAYRARYLGGLPGDSSTFTRRYPGPFTLAPVPTYWDDPYGGEYE